MTTQISGTTGVSRVQDGTVTQAKLAPNVVGNGPAFKASSATAGTMVVGSNAKLVMSSEVFDTANAYDPVQYRFTPQTAGYYQVNCTLLTNGTTGNIQVFIYKNGTLYSQSGYESSSAAYAGIRFSDLVFLNGSTDYIEMWGYSSVGNSSNQASSFSGFLARAA